LLWAAERDSLDAMNDSRKTDVPVTRRTRALGASSMDAAAVTAHIATTFADVHPVSAWGETSFFYNPGRALPRGVYFATLKEADGDHDRASALHRPGVYRLNIGLSKPTFRALFGTIPARPPAGGVVATGHDFTALDTLIPHPVYGWMAWIAVLNPSASTFATLGPLLDEGYRLAVGKFEKRVGVRPAAR